MADLTVAEIIALTGYSKETIYRWVRVRDFPRPTVGVWNREAVEAWWRDNKNKVGRHPK